MNNNTSNRKRQCNKCGWFLFPNTIYFNNDKKSKDGLNAICKQCRLEQRLRTKDKKSEYDKIYRIKNLERKQEYYKKWKEENREIYLAGKKEYNQKSRDKQKIWHENWVKNNKERYRKRRLINTHKRLAMKRSLPNDFTLTEWEECKKHFGNSCAYCGEKDKLQKEHFIPLSKGGEFTINNILPSCVRCNKSKYIKDFFEWYPQQEFYSKQRERKILKYLNYTKEKEQQLALL